MTKSSRKGKREHAASREQESFATLGARVRTLAASGFLFEPETTRCFLEDPWRHLYAWIHHEVPGASQLAALLYHLEAYSRDLFAPQVIGRRLSRTELESLLRQLAEYLANEVFEQLARNRALEALLRRDYERGFAQLESPRELARLLGLLGLLERYVAWPEAEASPELLTHLEAVLSRAERGEARSERHPHVSAHLVARVLAVLVPLFNGVHEQVLVPLAGATPGVVKLTLAVNGEAPPQAASGSKETSEGAPGQPLPAKRADEPRGRRAKSGTQHPEGATLPNAGAPSAAPPLAGSQASSSSHPAAPSSGLASSSNAQGAAPEVCWMGLPVSSEVRDGALTVLHAFDELAATLDSPVAAQATSPMQCLHLLVSETSHRPLERTVRLMAGRSWELGGLLTLLASRLGTHLERTAATGQIDVRSRTIEAVGGIEEKLEALYACRHPQHGPLAHRLICPASNVAAAERTARRLGWHELEIHGVTQLDELPSVAGADPWRDYLCELRQRAEQEQAELELPAGLLEEWQRRLREHVDGAEHVLVAPAPFGLDPQAWTRQLAALYAIERLERTAAGPTGSAAPVPVILPVEPSSAGFTELIAAGLSATQSTSPAAPQTPTEQTISNQFQRLEGFLFLHADPEGASPLFEPPNQPLNLSRRHPALKHRFCFVAADLHQLEVWRRHPLFARL